jgi:hypothetical protein
MTRPSAPRTLSGSSSDWLGAERDTTGSSPICRSRSRRSTPPSLLGMIGHGGWSTSWVLQRTYHPVDPLHHRWTSQWRMSRARQPPIILLLTPTCRTYYSICRALARVSMRIGSTTAPGSTPLMAGSTPWAQRSTSSTLSSRCRVPRWTRTTPRWQSAAPGSSSGSSNGWIGSWTVTHQRDLVRVHLIRVIEPLVYIHILSLLFFSTPQISCTWFSLGG